MALEELKRAVDEGRLALLPVARALAGAGRRYTATEIAERSALERTFLDEVWRALGIALAPEYRDYGDAQRSSEGG